LLIGDAARDEQLERRMRSLVDLGARDHGVAHVREPRGGHQLRDLGLGEAEPHVGLLFAQPVVAVRDEIDHDDGAARLDDADHLAKRGDGARGVVQYEGGEGGVDAAVGEGQALELAALERDVGEAEARGLGTRAAQHLGREIDRDDARRDLGQVRQHPAGAGTDVGDLEPPRDERHQRREAGRAREELRAQRVPVLGLIEEGLALRATTGEHALDATGELLLLGEAAQLVAEGACQERLVGDEAVERRRALLAHRDEPRLRQRLQVPRHARLRRLDDLGQLAYRQLFVEQGGQQDHASFLGEGLEAVEPGFQHERGLAPSMRSCKRMHERSS
jgi:hypothetical protein